MSEDGSVTTTTTIVTTETKQVIVKTPAKKPAESTSPSAALLEGAAPVAPTAALGEGVEDGAAAADGTAPESSVATITVEGGKVTVPYDDTNHVTIGLRVYTNKDVPASVVGRLRDEKKETKTTTASASATAAVTSDK